MKKVRDRCGIFVKKERECGISTLSSPPPPFLPPFQTPIRVNISTEMAEMVQTQQITVVYRKTVYFTHQGKYILGLGKEQDILIYSRFYKYHGRFRRYHLCTCC